MSSRYARISSRPVSSPCAPAAGSSVPRIHARNFGEAIQQQLQNFQAALREFLRLVGMLGGDAVQARDEFVYPRVVFHRAGAERVHAEVNRVIPRGKPREVADHFDLADFGKSFDGFAHVVRAQRRARIHGGHIERRQLEPALAGRGLLEDQPFILADVPPRFFDAIGQSISSCITGICLCAFDPVTHCCIYNCKIRRQSAGATQIGFDRMSRIAAAMRSISARDVVSVTQNRPRLVRSAK